MRTSLSENDPGSITTETLHARNTRAYARTSFNGIFLSSPPVITTAFGYFLTSVSVLKAAAPGFVAVVSLIKIFPFLFTTISSRPRAGRNTLIFLTKSFRFTPSERATVYAKNALCRETFHGTENSSLSQTHICVPSMRGQCHLTAKDFSVPWNVS